MKRIGTVELIDLVSSLIVLTAAFSIVGERSLPGIEIVLVSALGVGSGFLLHELAHKFTAQRYGYWAEYRANRMGLVLIIVMALAGFILAVPGAVVIRRARSYGFDPYGGRLAGDDKAELMRIALAGPLTNVVLAAFFFTLLAGGLATSRLAMSAAYYAFFINLILAGFNLIPAGPLDGGKVFKANPRLWAVVGVPTILAALLVFLGPGII